MEGLSEEFTSMPDVPAENESFGQRIRNFLWDKKYIFLTGCFASTSLSAVLLVYMMKQRSEHNKVLEVVKEFTELKAEHNTLLNAVKEFTELMILHSSTKSGNGIQTHYIIKGSANVEIDNTLLSQLKELEVRLGKLISLTTK